MFQFPSNGKLHSNVPMCYAKGSAATVSIPFKRETAFKLYLFLCFAAGCACFNSLQTGNCIQTLSPRLDRVPI